MGYKWGMQSGRGQVKEMKIRLDEKLRKGLERVAKGTHRSMTKQVISYIEEGIEADRKAPLTRTRLHGGACDGGEA